MKVLITVPTLHSKGGVSNYYRSIRNYFSVGVDFFTVGPNRWEKKTQIERIRRFILDPVRFCLLMMKYHRHYELVHLNPSFEYGSLVREAILLRIAKGWGKKAVMFFRGFDMGHAKTVDKYFRTLFISCYRRADCFVVLGSEFRDQLIEWGFTQPIYLETTLVDDKLVGGINIEARFNRIERNSNIKLLFLSRIVKEKGIMETLQAFKQLLERYDNLSLTVAGDGPFLGKALQFVKDNNLECKVSFPGFVSGEAKSKVLTDSDIYIFPSYTEGMPNSVLEAMAFGLPVVATPVGGIKDIVGDSEHGFLLKSNTPEAIAASVSKIINDKNLQKTMSANCFKSSSRYLASNVAARLEDIYETVISQ